ncbi:hypothetical protein [Pseudoteredinibacter isoporae]|uniref:hypothetical protein n=1 Tax=Pseudoteredinibacter isoporae TaxID=570281 RepID=UPI00333EE773
MSCVYNVAALASVRGRIVACRVQDTKLLSMTADAPALVPIGFGSMINLGKLRTR